VLWEHFFSNSAHKTSGRETRVTRTLSLMGKGRPRHADYLKMEKTFVDNTLLTLPTEILVNIISLVSPLRERIKIPRVSRRLRTACETPSLWRNFVWHCYQSGDEGCVNSIVC